MTTITLLLEPAGGWTPAPLPGAEPPLEDGERAALTRLADGLQEAGLTAAVLEGGLTAAPDDGFLLYQARNPFLPQWGALDDSRQGALAPRLLVGGLRLQSTLTAITRCGLVGGIEGSYFQQWAMADPPGPAVGLIGRAVVAVGDGVRAAPAGDGLVHLSADLPGGLPQLLARYLRALEAADARTVPMVELKRRTPAGTVETIARFLLEGGRVRVVGVLPNGASVALALVSQGIPGPGGRLLTPADGLPFLQALGATYRDARLWATDVQTMPAADVA